MQKLFNFTVSHFSLLALMMRTYGVSAFLHIYHAGHWVFFLHFYVLSVSGLVVDLFEPNFLQGDRCEYNFIFLYVNHLIFPTPFAEDIFLFPAYFWYLGQIFTGQSCMCSCLYLWLCFHWSTSLFLCQSRIIFNTMALKYMLTSGIVIAPALFYVCLFVICSQKNPEILTI